MTTKILVRVILGLQIGMVIQKIVEIQLEKRGKEVQVIDRLDELSNEIFKMKNPI